jgi:DNA replication initiation complex subunit (GINS family)
MIKDSPEIKLNEETIGPFKSGQEIELAYWMAEELVNSGLAKFRDQDLLDINKLTKIHWKETIPTSRQIPSLQKNFYFILKKFLKEVIEESKKDTSKIMLYERALALSRDIINCRVRKIISIAATSTNSWDMIKNMAVEEIALHNKLNSIIHEWNDNILKTED